MTNTDLTWDRESADEFSLWADEFGHVCTIIRRYEQVMSPTGFGLVDDKSKPATWAIVRPGKPTRKMGLPDMKVRAAKKLAESICRI